jgi:hypothetical protein
MKIRVHGNELRLLKVLDKDLPTDRTAIGDLDAWFRRNVLPRLDMRKKWLGCWMWEGATTTAGEPKIGFRDKVTRRAGRVGWLQTQIVKREIAKLFIDTKDLPARRYRNKAIREPDFDVVHLCENKCCLNPAHLLVSLTDAKQRDVIELRDKYLVPGTYHV